MARANLINIACANRAEVFKRFRDFVCKRNGTYDYSTTGIGWTLHDSSYATDEDTIATNDWFVIYSAGESGDEDLYMKCTYIANYIKIEGFLYWNATTHAGVQAYNTTSNFYIIDAAVPILWIYGDLDQVLGIARETSVSANFYPALFGKGIAMYNDEVAVCAGALSSGTDVSINVGTVPATGWTVGKKIAIRDTTRVDYITIKTVNASEITADLSNNYLAGAKLSADLVYGVLGSNNWGSNFCSLIAHNGTKGGAVGGITTATVDPKASCYPDPLNNDHIFGYWASYHVTYGYLGRVKDVLSRNSTGITALDVITHSDGFTYRAFVLYSGAYVMVKEV